MRGSRPAATVRRRGLPLNRRHVLGAAGATAGALAVARIVGLHDLGLPPPDASSATPGSRPAGGTHDWISPLSRPEAQVAHLLRRATFGASRQMHAYAVGDGYARTVDRLVETPAAEPPALPGGDEATQGKPINLADLRTWWLSWMLLSPTPFAERMTLFWHGHFTSDYRKVSLGLPYLYWQNLTWRRHALGDLRSFVKEVTIDPAMLRYLDLSQSTPRAPNENYSRELLELFTMGAGTFTEDDVRHGAFALSGWREPLTPQLVNDRVQSAIRTTGKPPPVVPKADHVRTGIFEPSRGFVGPSFAFLGQTKVWNTDSLIDRIMEQESVAPFIVRKILEEFVTPDPSDAYVKRLADTFRRTKYDLRTLMRDVFSSPEFLDPSVYRALVKSPTEFLVSLTRALEAPALARTLANAGATMGQGLFDVPDVGGWPSNASWISSVNVLSRVNFAIQALAGIPSLPPVKDAIAQQLDGTVAPKTAALLNGTSDEGSRWTILLASPEFQLK